MDRAISAHPAPASAEPVPGAAETLADAASYRIVRPAVQALPLVLASPHSGRDYPARFLAQSRLDANSLRRSEDCFVDELFAAAADQGAPLLSALFPRAWLDPNREPFELDPAMFDGPVPSFVNSRSPRVAAGLGTIPRFVSSGEEIYRGKLRFAEAMERVDRCYHPYHGALRRLIAETKDRFGYCILLDCHSMPTVGLPPELVENSRLDMVLGDCFGTACAPSVTAAAESCLERFGYSVGRNVPYAGGYTTKHYGKPAEGVHTLQIELNRALYVDEASLTRRPYMATLARHMEALVATLAALPAAGLLPRRR